MDGLRSIVFQSQSPDSGPDPSTPNIGFRSRGTLAGVDPLNKVPFKRARSRVKKGPL